MMFVKYSLRVPKSVCSWGLRIILWKDFIIKPDDVPATKEDRGGEKEREKKGGREGREERNEGKKSLQQWDD